MKDQAQGMKTGWLFPVAVTSCAALGIFWVLYASDYLVIRVEGPATGPVGHYLRFDPSSITDAVSSLAGMMAAVLGIVITVVSIIVQLSADRYTGVARMFLRDRVNLSVMGFYVITCVCGIWLSLGIQRDFVPHATLLAMLVATSAGLALMAPYFGYVFWFVEPGNIIVRIQRDAVVTATRGACATDARASALAQATTLGAMEELTDITSNSISGKDKIIASSAVDALKDFALAYLDNKAGAAPGWFAIGPAIRQNPDFVAMDPESLADLERRRTWVEWKVMRQYLGIFNEALGTMRDINYLVAIDTRYIGEAAALARDQELVALVLRFMNSYMRSALNARDVRTAYNVLNQYRLLIEGMIKQGLHERALEGARHLSYYGHVSFDVKLTFVTETVAYDVSSLCQIAHDLSSPAEEAMLGLFLELDRELRSSSQESALLGVRKAQVKLAAYYLLQGEERKARIIADDMAKEPRERLLTIRRALEAVTTKDFWEIIDRGRNFEFMPEAQREKLGPFFAWLGIGD
jgi:hypothetical protein